MSKGQKEETESESNVDIDICFVINGKNSCDQESEQEIEDPSVSSFTFDLNLVDPCEIATIDIDKGIIAESIYYGIYNGNTPISVLIDSDMVEFSPISNLCPDIVLEIVNFDGSPISGENFVYDTLTSEISIFSTNTTDVGQY